MKILLIAGHGGGSGTNYADPGACSSYGIEAEQTRRVANKLQQLLKPYMEVLCSVIKEYMRVNPDESVIIVSDHGMSTINNRIYPVYFLIVFIQ